MGLYINVQFVLVKFRNHSCLCWNDIFKLNLGNFAWLISGIVYQLKSQMAITKCYCTKLEFIYSILS